MSDHKVNIQWKRETSDFAYETYDRTHEIRFPGGQTIRSSAAVEFFGKAQHTNPEEMLAASLATCHMLTFLAIAAKSRMRIDSYEDNPVAHLDKGPKGKLCVTKISLHPKVHFSGDVIPDSAKLRDLHGKAHSNCFIANSLACEMLIEPIEK